jgi:hypothetical protein
MSHNIQHIRLINGDEIIGDVLDIYLDKVLISCPLIVTERMSTTGKPATVLTKYLPFSSNEVCEISLSHIIVIADIHEEMMKFYFHSLRISNEYEEQMLSQVKEANIRMEASMMDDVAINNGTSSSSNSLH